jgi:ubiquinone/menaquinone biosynthesis C-methylase UbiE
MSDPMPFDEAAPYYHLRAPYAPEALDYVCEAFGLDARSRVLDLGCGIGTLTIPFSRKVGAVLAVDRNPAMLAEGKRRGDAERRANITWLCMTAEAVTDALGMVDAAVMGQSFHWMHRDTVLANLAPMIRAGGGIALIGPSLRLRVESTEAILDPILARYLGPRGSLERPDPEPANEPALLRSAHFSGFHARFFIVEFKRDIASVIGHVYSMSYSPRSKFGDRLGAFEREAEAALRAANPGGMFRERIETEVQIAPKR